MAIMAYLPGYIVILGRQGAFTVFRGIYIMGIHQINAYELDEADYEPTDEDIEELFDQDEDEVIDEECGEDIGLSFEDEA